MLALLWLGSSCTQSSSDTLPTSLVSGSTSEATAPVAKVGRGGVAVSLWRAMLLPILGVEAVMSDTNRRGMGREEDEERRVNAGADDHTRARRHGQTLSPAPHHTAPRPDRPFAPCSSDLQDLAP